MTIQLYMDTCDSVDKTQPFIMGIDEAGRGPVMGPMVYGSCWCPVSQQDALKKLKFDDSKKLSENAREKLFDVVLANSKIMGFQTVVSTPEHISQLMNRRTPVSLNVISHDSAIQMIESVLKKGINLQEVYLDTVGTPKTYQDKLYKLFPNIPKIVVSSKADSLYPIVSAASICAKVIRDSLVKNTTFDQLNLSESETPNLEFGSGYPSDPVTKKWLTDNGDKIFGFPNCIRFSWSTAVNAMKKQSCHVVWPPKNNAKPSKYFVPTSENIKNKRFQYFEQNSISRIDNEF
ncbi:ribonuclease H2 subunit A [Tieghemostelium lacteum]|uniref:Ribonuclease n=1 Tax=Tieghemostelium lacteum TaxID=361077 RepID=A0A151Z397_TIELA|nr:ribonuclease H2 subunit A [Tieghemostelium lacteum]|eukprot:KYQ88421.1 ribonuclease H2 subunit A [Tieghemostelium lacteum]